MYYADNILLLLCIKHYALRDMVPFFQAPPATGCGSMLRDKYRMAAHGRLFSVIRRISRRQSFSDEVRGVLVNGVSTFIPTVLPLFRPQAKARTKCGTRQSGK
jgi:hypothetical protein